MDTPVNIFSCSAFSMVKVSKDVFEVLSKHVDTKLRLGYFRPSECSGTAIIICNPCRQMIYIYNALKKLSRIKNYIFYITVEGYIQKGFLPQVQFLKEHTLVTPSHYVKMRLEEQDFHVEDVIPHGVKHFGEPKHSNPKTLGYIAGYLQRKYPKYGIKAIVKANVKPYLITTRNNPFIRYFNVISLDEYNDSKVTDDFINAFYRLIGFYLNLSDSEGFGITPLEALAFGTPVIAPEIPPLVEHLPDFTFWVQLTGNKWYEKFGMDILIEHYEYDSSDMVDKILEALQLKDSEYYELSKKSIEFAKKYDIHKVYTRFLKILGV